MTTATIEPLLTRTLCEQIARARTEGATHLECSLDLDRSRTVIELGDTAWRCGDRTYAYLPDCRERTVYYWDDRIWRPVARYGSALVKLVPTEWGPPTFEIDGIKMLPTSTCSPLEDARVKVGWVEPAGKRILDTCGGLGYFAACCLEAGATHVHSFEASADVLWVRALNPWSPPADARLQLEPGDVVQRIRELGPASFDAILHDPPRFGIAGELYSGEFYAQLARVLRRRGKMFHYTGTPNRLTSGRDVPREVARRLEANGFQTVLAGDGVLASRRP